jgi:hypothetical protein
VSAIFKAVIMTDMTTWTKREKCLQNYMNSFNLDEDLTKFND